MDNKLDACVPATITKITTMADRGLRLQVDTQEITDAELKKQIFDLHDKLGFFFFSEAPITEVPLDDLPEIKVEEGEKTPSQRLRNILFVLWEQKKIKESFDIFYRKQIEKLIEKIKEQLQ